MNIVHVTASFRPAIGGVSNHVLNVCKTQIACGHNVTVITAMNEIYSESEVIDNINVARFPSHRSPLRVKLWHLRNHSLYRNADVIHIHSLYSIESIPAFLIKKSKTVITLHGWGGKYPIPDEQIERVSTGVPKVASGVITVGSFVNKWFKVKSDETIYGATSLTKVTQEKEYDICILGRLEEDTGINAYIEALREICKRSTRRLNICVCGDGSLRGKLYGAISNDADIYFKGFVDNPQYYMHRSVCCFTSGYLGILEALTLGCNVYSIYENPVKRDYLCDSPYSEFIIVASSSGELADCFIGGTQPNKPLEDFVDEDFSWERVCRVYDNVYEKVGMNIAQ